MTEAWRKASWLMAILAAAFCVYAAYLYQKAGTPPASPRTHAAPAIKNVPVKRRVPNAARYAGMAGGRIFFGEPVPGPTAPGTPAPVYVSGLMLRGITYSRTPTALLARIGSPPEAEAWTARVGQTILGETVVAIERRSVILRRDGQDTVLYLPD